jgi:NAD(P)-dependent dehydrogenase (short-subunit alcohol dehydrogenase family)
MSKAGEAMKVQDTAVFVSGSNRGIGRALVDALLRAGARRVYAGMRTVEPVQSEKVTPVRLDLTDPATIKTASQQCADISILINNAGTLEAQPLIGARDPHGAEREMRVNYFGTLHMCRAFAPVLQRAGGGAIVNILSILSRMNMPSVGSYSASKAAALSLTQGMRAELSAQGTLVVAVMPAFVDTDMTRHLTLPKLPASAVADAALTALHEGIEDVYPGFAAEIAGNLQRDHKAVERQFASMFRPT